MGLFTSTITSTRPAYATHPTWNSTGYGPAATGYHTPPAPFSVSPTQVNPGYTNQYPSQHFLTPSLSTHPLQSSIGPLGSQFGDIESLKKTRHGVKIRYKRDPDRLTRMSTDRSRMSSWFRGDHSDDSHETRRSRGRRSRRRASRTREGRWGSSSSSSSDRTVSGAVRDRLADWIAGRKSHTADPDEAVLEAAKQTFGDTGVVAARAALWAGSCLTEMVDYVTGEDTRTRGWSGMRRTKSPGRRNEGARRVVNGRIKKTRMSKVPRTRDQSSRGGKRWWKFRGRSEGEESLEDSNSSRGRRSSRRSNVSRGNGSSTGDRWGTDGESRRSSRRERSRSLLSRQSGRRASPAPSSYAGSARAEAAGRRLSQIRNDSSRSSESDSDD